MSKGEERKFRLRPRKPPLPRKRNESAPWALAFKTIAHYARTSARTRQRKRSRGTSARRAATPRNQRCAIRVTYSRNTVRGQWRAHGRYVARESATIRGTPGFDAANHGIDMAERLHSWQSAGDQRLWKLIISPEFGERIDLVRLTRDLMNRVEIDLKIPLEWIAVAHFNTDHPHVHVALRGIGRDQQQVRVSREYVKTGIRSVAEDFCTRQLGHRTDLDAAAAERREIPEKRFTSLDRVIVRSAERVDGEPFWLVKISTARLETGEDDFAWNKRQHLIKRLAVLEDMGLARCVAAGAWTLRPDVEGVLRAMQRTGDRQKVLAAHGVLLSDERLPMQAFDLRRMTAVEGRILVHGEDEQSGRHYLMLEGVDAQVHFIEYTADMEAARARGELRTNSFIRLRRILVDQQPTLQIEDLGDSQTLLRNKRYFQTQAEHLLKRAILPTEDGWGGWLGQYQSALKQAAMAIEYPAKRDHGRQRDRSRAR